MENEYDFSNMMYNVSELPSGSNILSVYPRLKQYSEFNKVGEASAKANLEKIFRYIVYFYDKNSPLKDSIENIIKRKIEAARLAGFVAKVVAGKNVFSPIAKQMLNCKNEAINKMIIRYCRMQGSRDFSLLVSGQEAFYNTLLQLIDPDDENAKETKDKQAVFSQAKKNSDQLKELEVELLNEDTNKYLTEDLYDYVEEEARKQLLLSPEDYAFNLG